MNLEERFWSKVDRRGPDECWPWLAYISRSTGYGTFGIGHANVGAHRVSYELSVGPIPDGLQIDHLCRVRHCVNPAHLEPVTLQENLRRGLGSHAAGAAFAVKQRARTHCKRGHEFTQENTRHYRGKRCCRKCAVLLRRKYRAAYRVAA